VVSEPVRPAAACLERSPAGIADDNALKPGRALIPAGNAPRGAAEGGLSRPHAPPTHKAGAVLAQEHLIHVEPPKILPAEIAWGKETSWCYGGLPPRLLPTPCLGHQSLEAYYLDPSPGEVPLPRPEARPGHRLHGDVEPRRESLHRGTARHACARLCRSEPGGWTS
jgi:hypothetical protein